MLRCVTYIKITQRTKGRSKVLNFDFVSEFEANDTWVDLTNQATVKLPKNVFVRDKNGMLMPIGGVNTNIGGFDNDNPLFLRGDKIEIAMGYFHYDKLGNEFIETSTVFEGYITEVVSKKPIELKCEDNFWLLKQIPAPNKSFPKTATYEDILRELFSGTEFTVNALTQTTFGGLRIMNETVAQVIERVRKDYHIEGYFRGSEYRVGSIIYVEAEARLRTFTFQKNIIEDDLTYKRKDDIKLSAVCYSVSDSELGDTTATGRTKTKKERLEILIYADSKGNFTYKTKEQGYPPNSEGERRTLYFWNIKSAAELFEKGKAELQKYYYTGFTGNFTTFGLPYVRMGDNVNLIDPILPERNGRYKVKGVEYSGGTGGHRQKIILDYLIFRIDEKGNKI